MGTLFKFIALLCKESIIFVDKIVSKDRDDKRIQEEIPKISR